MLEEIRIAVQSFTKSNDIRRFSDLLNAADKFVSLYQNGIANSDELEVGIELFKALTTLSYIGQLREFEHDYDLHNRIIKARVRVFKACIPQQGARLRGLTEMLLGMKENELG